MRSIVASGMDSHVYALAVSGGDVYAGGYFTVAGGGTANRIAKWDCSTWSGLGSGMSDAIFALAEILAKRFLEELGFRLPAKRRPWMSEDYRMDIFDAVALDLMVSNGGSLTLCEHRRYWWDEDPLSRM